MKTLNEVYSSLSAGRRYEVWFIRLGLADGRGAWWFRYLLMNPGRDGCAEGSRAMPAQVWATWFPREGKPQSYIEGFPLEALDISARSQNPFYFRVAGNEIGETGCRGALDVGGHKLAWELHYRSTFRVTLSNKGWIGFSRSPHSDAVFSGRITLDDESFEADPLGFGVQGHNCGYRHRNFWTWGHAYFERHDGPPSTLEALVYEMPFRLRFRKAVLWHDGEQRIFRNLQESTGPTDEFGWNFCCSSKDGLNLKVAFDGRGDSLHRLPYLKTNCAGSFEVRNNSLSRASVCLEKAGMASQELNTDIGAVLETAGRG